ncbi:MAG: hypothetical protein M3124_04005 [Actinomycetota bacterium]|nr:hypothetical protein [Actinomycetota bacterium]
MAPVECCYLVLAKCFTSNRNRSIYEAEGLIGEPHLQLSRSDKVITLEREHEVSTSFHTLAEREPHFGA